MTWLEPTLSVELPYSEIMEGRLRDPVYRGIACRASRTPDGHAPIGP